jgi:hypothetical protein
MISFRVTPNQLWSQDSAGIAENAQGGERFGSALASGDFDNDGFDDLAIGAPWEDLAPGVAGMAHGGVHVIFGSLNRLTATGGQFWTQNSNNVPDTAEVNDYFGASFGAGDFNDGGRADLVIGVPEESMGNIVDAGVIHVLPGSASGPTATGNQLWSQDSSGILGTAQSGDFFGISLSR